MRCGKEIPDGSVFCLHCGMSQSQIPQAQPPAEPDVTDRKTMDICILCPVVGIVLGIINIDGGKEKSGRAYLTAGVVSLVICLIIINKNDFGGLFMFCSKCGKQISEDIQYCPGCGSINENYSEKATAKKLQVTNYSSSRIIGKVATNKIKIVGIIIVLFATILLIAGSLFLGKNKPGIKSSIGYIKHGVNAYTSDDGYAAFYVDGDILKFDIEAKEGYSSPDYSKYVILTKDSKLVYFNLSDREPVNITSDASYITKVNNSGVFFKKETGNSQQMLYYSFEKNEIVDIVEFDEYNYYAYDFSQADLSVICISKTNEVVKYTTESNAPEIICKTGNNMKAIGISDNGETVLWSEEKDGDVCIYTLKNGAPERIGKMGKSEDYYNIYSLFFDDGKSYLIYSSYYRKMFLCKEQGDAIEISMPNKITYHSPIDENGDKISSEKSKPNYLYFDCSESNERSTLYKLEFEGNIDEVVSNIKNDSWRENFKISNNSVYYLDKDGDLFVKNLKDGKSERITTDIEQLYISPKGEYAYIVKSGSLYCWDTNDTSHKLETISSNFGEDESLYLTDKDNTIYYTSGTIDIEYYNNGEKQKTYSERSMLNKFVYNNQSFTDIEGDVMSLLGNDSEYVSAENPIVRKYINVDIKDNSEETYDTYDIICDIGYMSNDTFIQIASNIRY